jgi:hypothetical protein
MFCYIIKPIKYDWDKKGACTMSRTEKYQMAWERYLLTCRRYDIETTIDFVEFVKRLLPEQVEMMLQK